MKRELVLTVLLIVIVSSLVVQYPPPYYIYIIHELLLVFIGIWILSLAFPRPSLEKMVKGVTLAFILFVLLLAPLTSFFVPHYSVKNADAFTDHVDHLTLNIGERPYLSESEGIAADYIRDVLEQRGYTPQGSSNVMVKVDGKREDVVLFCAHYDTVHGSPGADDNASGVSVLLEVEIPRSPEYTIMLIFFTGEEAGLVESRAFAQSTEEQISAVICVDTVGRGEHLHISSMKKNRTTSFFLSQLIFGLSDEGQPSVGPLLSDHVPFNDRGIPAVGLTRSTNRNYPHIHSEQDILVNRELLAKTGNTVQMIVEHFSQSRTPYRGVYGALGATVILSVLGSVLLLYFLESQQGNSSTF
jgi:hypothetical protein